jgi:hypothetical protein
MSKKKFDPDEAIAGRTTEEWDRRWVDVPGGFSVAHPELYGKAGLYRALEEGEVVFLGRSSAMRPENRLTKRLYDLRRPGDSGRRYRGGAFIHEHMDELGLQVLIVGNDQRACGDTVRLLRGMLSRRRPRENAPLGVIDNAVKASYRKTGAGHK